MKALILVGGFGTRLRPLTFSVPKPLVPFCNLPILVHQIEALVKVGVKKIILAVNYQPQTMMEFLKTAEKKYGISIVISQENEPLGTAGPIALARDLLLADDSPFFMLNSDVICEFPLQQMIDFHQNRQGEGTILVTPVKDPSKYGVVVADPRGEIEAFIEKPPGPNFPSHNINAGIYLFSTDIIKRVQLKPTSIEREIFPKIAQEHKLFSMQLPGYWMDVGQPKDFITGTTLHLASLKKHFPAVLTPESDTIRGNVLIDPSAKIGAGVLIGPDVVIGPNVVIEDGARIKQSTVFDGAIIHRHAFIQRTIIGWSSHIGSWARVTESVCGEDVTIAQEVAVNDAIVCPHKEIKEDSLTAKIHL